MNTSDFDFALPPELIAQHPTERRDQSRLLVIHRAPRQCLHQHFSNLIQHLHPGDLLVFNDSKVIPARLRGRGENDGPEFELLLLEENQRNDWWAMMKPGKKARPGTIIRLSSPTGARTDICATVQEHNAEGHRRLRFEGTPDILAELDGIGEIPLPPYIKRPAKTDSAEDRERYQTVYARAGGSIAAPTAGLHFTAQALEALRAAGVETCFLTLHVGLGTFAPVKSERLEDHPMHQERYSISETTAQRLEQARREKRRIIPVGTTSLRALESAAADSGQLRAEAQARTRIFIHPPFKFQVADALLTNFHLPCSTLLMLVSAFASPGSMSGREWILSVYQDAVREHYRFFSYGDAMFIQ